MIESPAWHRLASWWDGLSRRERVLVGTLGGLVIVAILVFGVIRPLQAARADARSDIRTYETLNARIRAAGRLGPQVPQRSGPPADVIAQSAATFGLAIRSEAVPGGIRVTIADASYDSVMNWMADLARTSSLAATRAELRRGPGPGRVAATVEFA